VRAVGSNKDNGGNSNGRGHMQQSIKKSCRRNNGGSNGDWQQRRLQQWQRGQQQQWQEGRLKMEGEGEERRKRW
jgi:hypothetical protein